MESSMVMAVTSSNATGIPLCEAASESHAMISGVLNPDKMVGQARRTPTQTSNSTFSRANALLQNEIILKS